MTTPEPTLRCSCCGATMTPAEAMPAPTDITPVLFYHADLQACVRVALAHLADAKPWMRAMLGANDANI